MDRNEHHQFDNMVRDKNTGEIYIGTVNKLYHLSPDLRLIASAITGPKEDSPFCSVILDCPPNVERKSTDNFNKAEKGTGGTVGGTHIVNSEPHHNF